jgi:hypothetical protein
VNNVFLALTWPESRGFGLKASKIWGIEGDFWLWPWYQSQKAVAFLPEARARETLFVKAFFSTSFDQNLLPRLPIVHSNREPRYSLLIISITHSLYKITEPLNSASGQSTPTLWKASVNLWKHRHQTLTRDSTLTYFEVLGCKAAQARSWIFK